MGHPLSALSGRHLNLGSRARLGEALPVEEPRPGRPQLGNC